MVMHDSVLDAVRAGRLDGLRAMRDNLAECVADAPVMVRAQIVGQLAKVMAEIEELESASPEVSESDRIRAELAAGLSEAKVVQLAGRSRKPRAG